MEKLNWQSGDEVRLLCDLCEYKKGHVFTFKKWLWHSVTFSVEESDIILGVGNVEFVKDWKRGDKLIAIRNGEKYKKGDIVEFIRYYVSDDGYFHATDLAYSALKEKDFELLNKRNWKQGDKLIAISKDYPWEVGEEVTFERYEEKKGREHIFYAKAKDGHSCWPLSIKNFQLVEPKMEEKEQDMDWIQNLKSGDKLKATKNGGDYKEGDILTFSEWPYSDSNFFRSREIHERTGIGFICSIKNFVPHIEKQQPNVIQIYEQPVELGSLVVIDGRTASGKTSLVAKIVSEVLNQNRKIMVLSEDLDFSEKLKHQSQLSYDKYIAQSFEELDAEVLVIDGYNRFFMNSEELRRHAVQQGKIVIIVNQQQRKNSQEIEKLDFDKMMAIDLSIQMQDKCLSKLCVAKIIKNRFGDNGQHIIFDPQTGQEFNLVEK